MPRPDQSIVNPVTGERIVFRRTARQTDGECLAFDVQLRPGGVIAGAPHHHPHEERFHVTHGRFAGWIAGEGTFSKGPGDRLVIPPFVDHLVFNASLGFSRAEVEARPGGEFDRLLEAAFALSRGRLSLAGTTARLMRDQRLRVSLVPDALQERILGVLAT